MKTSLRFSGRTRSVALVAVIALAGVAAGAVLTSAAGSDNTSSFVPITPCRLMDTRSGSQIGPRGTPIGAGETYSATVWGANGNCVIPTTATAISLNVTFVNPTSAGFVTVYPPDKPWPGTSNLNFSAGQEPAPNGVTSPLSFDGKIGFFNEAGTVNLIADIVGYYEQSGSAPGGIVSGNCSAILRWDLPECKEAYFATGDSPHGVAFDGTSIWVANNGSNTVSKINPATGAKVDFPTGVGPRSVAFDGTSIWVTNGGSNTVSKINPTTGTKVDFPTGLSPQGVAFDGNTIWVANGGSGTVSKINPATGVKVDFPTGGGPEAVAFDGHWIWVAEYSDDVVTQYHPISGIAGASYPAGDEPQGLAFDGVFLWVTAGADNTVKRINVTTGSTDTFPTGLNPWGVAFDGTHVWVVNNNSLSVSKFVAVTGDRADFDIGLSPVGVAFDGSNIWVTNSSDDTVGRAVP